MAYTIGLTNHKGGVGKTTSTIAIGCEWQRRGLAVLLVDTDPQRHLVGFAELAQRAGFGEEVPTVRALPGEGVARQLRGLSAGYDLVLIDSPPRYLEIQAAVAAASDLMIIPTGIDQTELWCLSDAAALARAQMAQRDCAAVALLTRFNARTVAGRHAAAVIADSGLGLLDVRLSARVDYSYQVSAGRGITNYMPRSEAAREVRALCDELEAFAGGAIPTYAAEVTA